MQGLNLLGDPAPAEKPPPEEPLGLDLIRGWLAKPRPRLRALWLWVPYLANGVREGYRWLRKNSGPALRRTAETLRKAARVAQALRGAAERLRVRLERTFPPGSRGREVAAHLASGSRLLLRSALVLLGIGPRSGARPRVHTGARARRTTARIRAAAPRKRAGPRTSRHRIVRAPDEPGASTGDGPAVRDEPADAPDPTAGRHPPASAGPGSSASEVPRQESPQQDSRPSREPSEPERSREDSPASGSAEPAATGSSPRSPACRRGRGPEALAKLSKGLRGRILRLGKRPRKGKLRYTIWRILNERGASTSDDLGLLLQMDPDNLVKRHLSLLVEDGAVQRTIPERINHPRQAYRSTRFRPGLPPAGRQRVARPATPPTAVIDRSSDSETPQIDRDLGVRGPGYRPDLGVIDRSWESETLDIDRDLGVIDGAGNRRPRISTGPPAISTGAGVGDPDIDRTLGVIDRSWESETRVSTGPLAIIDRSSESETRISTGPPRYRPELGVGDPGYRPDLPVIDRSWASKTLDIDRTSGVIAGAGGRRSRISTGPPGYRPELGIGDSRYRPDSRRYRPEFGSETRISTGRRRRGTAVERASAAGGPVDFRDRRREVRSISKPRRQGAPVDVQGSLAGRRVILSASRLVDPAEGAVRMGGVGACAARRAARVNGRREWLTFSGRPRLTRTELRVRGWTEGHQGTAVGFCRQCVLECSVSCPRSARHPG